MFNQPLNNQNKENEEEGEDLRTTKTGKKFRTVLQKGRLKKGWKQQQLAQALNVKQNIINQYESGKAVPNSQLISKINRILNIKLPPVNKPKKIKFK